MEQIKAKISQLEEELNEKLDGYVNAGVSTEGDYQNQINEIQKKIDKLKRLLPQNSQTTTDNLIGINQPEPPISTQQSDDLSKAISLFIERSSKLNYKSTTEDFKDLVELKTAFFNKILSSFIGSATYDPTTTSKFSYVIASRVYSLDSLDDSIKNDISTVRNKENEAKWYDRAIIATSISLSLIQGKKFDCQKADFLLDFIADFEDGVWQRALTGLVLSLLVHENKWQRFDRLRNRLTKLQEIESIQNALFNIEFILRNNQYKLNFFNEKIFSIDYFKDNPLHFFLPFYKENEMLSYCFENSKCSEITYDDLIDYASSSPFLDSYKYSLFLGLRDNSTKFKKIKGEHKAFFVSLVNAIVEFHPFHNLISEYYFFYKYYPTKYADEFINTQTTIYGTKLRNVIFNNFNRLKLNADKCMRERKFNAAISDLEQAIAIYESEDIQYNLATCYIEREKYQKAEVLLEKMIQNNDSDKNTKLKLGRCYRLSGKYDDAQRILEPLVLEYPKKISILLEFAKLKSALKQNDEAIKFLQDAEAISPSDIDLLSNIGDVYYNLGDFDNALKYHIKVKYTGPKDKWKNIINLAHDYEGLSDYKMALDYTEKAISMRKDNPYAWMLKGRIYFVGKIDLVKASKSLLHSLSLSKMHVTYGNLGHVELVKGNKDLALRYYKECVLRFNNINDFVEKYNYDLPYIRKYGILQEEYEKIRDDMVEYWYNNDKIISDNEIETDDDN